MQEYKKKNDVKACKYWRAYSDSYVGQLCVSDTMEFLSYAISFSNTMLEPSQ